jgi:hypothetical protein
VVLSESISRKRQQKYLKHFKHFIGQRELVIADRVTARAVLKIVVCSHFYLLCQSVEVIREESVEQAIDHKCFLSMR